MGAQLGPYRLMGQVGEGGMSVVHLALDPTGRPVAVKVLRPHVAGDAEGRARFAREARALARVRGPHVAEVLHVAVEPTGGGWDTDPPYVVTEYVPGRPLHAVVEQDGPLDVSALVRLATGLADALCTIHAAGVVHRDLKPGNVLVVDGQPTVIDFGIAALADDTRLTATGLLVGTPGFLAPELLDGHPAGPPADVHAWGATLAYAATGRPPFGRGPLEVVLGNVARGTADLDGVPAAVLPLVRAALAPRPADRPDAWTLAAWSRQLTAASAPARPGTPAQPTPPVRHPVGAAASAAADTRVLPAAGAPVTRPLTAASTPTGPPHPTGGPSPVPVGAPLRGTTRGPVLGLAAVLVALAAAAPLLTVLVVVLGLLVVRIADRAALATVDRWARRGRPSRSRDRAVVLAGLPWHVLAGGLAGMGQLVLPLAAALSSGVLAGLFAAGAGLGSGAAVGGASAVAVLLALAGTGRRGAPLQRVSAWLVPRVLRSRTARGLAQVLLFATALFVASGALVADPVWWPAPAPDTAGLLDQLRGRP